MKKVLNFILSFVQPRKMVRYRNINLFLIVLIFLCCTILCAETSNFTLDKYIKRNKENFRLFSEVYNLSSDQEVKLPKFTLDKETGAMSNFTIGEEADNIYDFSFSLKDNKTLNLTLVYEPDVYVNDNEKTVDIDERILKFDLNGYYNHEPKRADDGTLLEQDMLLVITNELVYYIFNHGYDLVKQEDGSYNRYLESTGWSIMEKAYVLPKDATEIEYLEKTSDEEKVIDTSKWTLVSKRGDTIEIGTETYTAVQKDEVAYFLPANQQEAEMINVYGDMDITKWTMLAGSKDDKKVINGVEYLATPRLNQNIHEIFVSETSSRVGVFSLYQASNLGVNLGNLDDTKTTVNPKLMVEAVANLMVGLGAQQLQSYNLLYSLIFMIFMPILFTFATWIMAKKFGELTRFKEYYAICAISFVPTTILVALFTLFIEPYAFIAQYAMFIQVAYFIFCVYRINSMNRTNSNTQINTPKKEEKKEAVIDLEVDPTPIQENISRTAKME